jgi:hypothetical protein
MLRSIKQLVFISFFIFISPGYSLASNTTPIEFSITSNTVGYDAFGIGCEISIARSTPTITIPELVANTQHVYVSSSIKSEDGTQETVVLSYNAESNTTGLGIKVYYDSSMLTLSEITDVLQTNLILFPEVAYVVADADNEDGNVDTDTFIILAWTSFTSSWPESTPADLLTMSFDIAEGATGSSVITFTKTSGMPGWGFEGQTHELSFGSQAPNHSDNCDSPANLSNKQAVYVADSRTVGSQKLVTIGYASSDDSLTGLGVRVHYDSSVLTLSEITDVLQTDIIIAPQGDYVVADTDDRDNNPNTDTYINASWVSLFGSWPGASPIELYTLTFDIIGYEAPIQPKQLISVANTPRGIMGKTSVLEIAYDTTDNNNQLSGLGLRVHFDSSLLSFKGTTDIIEQDIIVNGEGPFNDSADLDNDPLTDQYMSFGWASLFNNWPDTNLPTILMNMAFDVSNSFGIDSISSTNINFTDSAFTSGYEFNAETYSMEILKATWDFDENGQADALSDGLMMIRYLFGLRGSIVTNSTMSSDSPLSSDEIVANIEAAMDIADIDADDKHNALTDGLLLMRYLFGLRDNSLTQNVVSPEAARFAAEEVEEYIERFMPDIDSSDSDSSDSDSSDSDSSGSDSSGGNNTGNTATFSTGAFEGAAYDEETSTFSFPSSAKSYAGFGNNNTDLYPMTFDNGGCVTFNASAETDLKIRFKFEKQPYPGNMPEMFTDWMTISGTEQEYTLNVPPSATTGNTYSSFLLFIDPDYKDLPVVITDVVATNTGACGI